MMKRSASPSGVGLDVLTALPEASRTRPAEIEYLTSLLAPAASKLTSIDLSVNATPSYRSPLAECCLIVLTSFRQPQVVDVSASILVTSPVVNAMLKSSMNSRAVARTCVATASAAAVGVAAAVVGVPLIGLALAEALDDAAGLGDDETGALAGDLGVASDGAALAASLVLPSALGWLTFAEQPASSTRTPGSAAPSRSESRVPRRYPTGGGYGRCVT